MKTSDVMEIVEILRDEEVNSVIDEIITLAANKVVLVHTKLVEAGMDKEDAWDFLIGVRNRIAKRK